MDASPETLEVLCHHLACEGVTSFLATTMTTHEERLIKVLQNIAQCMQLPSYSSVLGIHLEGPFIAKDKRGAHGPQVSLPDIEVLKRWQDLAQGAIKRITLAPELPHAMDFIVAAKNMDIAISIGHTQATYEQTMAAIAAGCSQATHLFNAMGGIHQRHPGAVTAILLSEFVTAEIIVDGLHLHPAIVDLIFQMKQTDKLFLVTDAIRATCLGDGQYDLGGQEVQVREGKAALADGTLAGSTLLMAQAIKNMMAFTHCSLVEAVQMATLNPARALKIDNRKGIIDMGMDADIVVLDAALNVKLCIQAGKLICENLVVNE